MELFIAYYGWDYDNGYILGIFSTREKALEALAKFGKIVDYKGYHTVSLDEVQKLYSVFI